MSFLNLYSRRFQRLVLSRTGEIPAAEPDLSREDRDAMLTWIALAWELISKVNHFTQGTGSSPTIPTGTERWLALKRWHLAHHLFMLKFGVIAFCLEKCVSAVKAGNRTAAGEWNSLAARMRKGCGSLFMYSISFRPTARIYCDCLRQQMPPGFSGYAIRERQHCLQPAIAALVSAIPKESTTSLKEIRSTWDDADAFYHHRHEESMVAAVPPPQGQDKPESLLEGYRHNQGAASPVSEERFCEFDDHFGVERSSSATLADYVFQGSERIEWILVDLLVAHRLSLEDMTNLLDGMKAALETFARWLGPVDELSAFYPKTLRGE